VGRWEVVSLLWVAWDGQISFPLRKIANSINKYNPIDSAQLSTPNELWSSASKTCMQLSISILVCGEIWSRLVLPHNNPNVLIGQPDPALAHCAFGLIFWLPSDQRDIASGLGFRPHICRNSP